MREVRHENFRIHADESRRDEFGQLAQSFNRMADKLNFLIEEDLRSKILLQETEYKFLCAQINPHFLYNTLDAMSWLAAAEGNQSVSDMAIALGRMMRWAISNKESLVPLQQEVNNVRDYLTIQRMRYGPDFSVEMQIDPAAGAVLIPKMTLQPLVENALIHGLELKEGEKRLLISASIAEENLTVCVVDNGVGMEEERVRTLLEQSQEEHGEYAGIGVGNVYRRIQMIYRERGSIQVDSRPNGGTKICLTMPVETGKEKADGPSHSS